MSQNSINIVAIFTIKAEYEAEFRTEFKKIVDASRQEAGCIRYDLSQDMKDPLVYIFTETWASQDAITTHNATPHFKAFFSFIDGKVAHRQVHLLKQQF